MGLFEFRARAQYAENNRDLTLLAINSFQKEIVGPLEAQNPRGFRV